MLCNKQRKKKSKDCYLYMDCSFKPKLWCVWTTAGYTAIRMTSLSTKALPPGNATKRFLRLSNQFKNTKPIQIRKGCLILSLQCMALSNAQRAHCMVWLVVCPFKGKRVPYALAEILPKYLSKYLNYNLRVWHLHRNTLYSKKLKCCTITLLLFPLMFPLRYGTCKINLLKNDSLEALCSWCK